ncbi:MAG: GNAT family protein [Azospirillaceae bacterium]|nr:GNAT family protein [Azospirillaceae bacterium]
MVRNVDPNPGTALHVRPFDAADVALLVSWFTREIEIVLWSGEAFHWPLDAPQMAKMIEESQGNPPGRTLWAVTTDDGTMVGHFQLVHDDRRRTDRLCRVVLSPTVRGRGLGAVLVRLAARTAFNSESAPDRLELYVYDHNAVARAAYRRAGFVEEGLLRQNLAVIPGDGNPTRISSMIVMALLRPEWQALQPATPRV